MKKLKFLAGSMILAALGLLIYCGSFYVRSYEQNKMAREEYEAIGLLARGNGESENYGKNYENILKKKMETAQNATDKKKQDISMPEIQKGRKKPAKRKGNKKKNNADKIRESFGISWENLRKINPEVVAWITVPGADISYPVVQGTDDEYYLKHNFQGKEDLFGCIFLGHDNKKNLTDSHSFLYGHNMEGNMMFANLNRYEQPEFLQSCPEIEITTPEKKYLYKIFSVEQAAPASAAFEYGYALKSRAYRQQLAILKENSMYDTGVWPEPDRRMVTLITCNSRLDKEIRMAVHGICYTIIER